MLRGRGQPSCPQRMVERAFGAGVCRRWRSHRSRCDVWAIELLKTLTHRRVNQADIAATRLFDNARFDDCRSRRGTLVALPGGAARTPSGLSQSFIAHQPQPPCAACAPGHLFRSHCIDKQLVLHVQRGTVIGGHRLPWAVSIPGDLKGRRMWPAHVARFYSGSCLRRRLLPGEIQTNGLPGRRIDHGEIVRIAA